MDRLLSRDNPLLKSARAAARLPRPAAAPILALAFAGAAGLLGLAPFAVAGLAPLDPVATRGLIVGVATTFAFGALIGV
ncbi:MAG: hypothetical protein NZ518_11855, partial [Dehalococcoidia bacterium]|nr:hypothetical protein [Dehalococcoidia bacterium]